MARAQITILNGSFEKTPTPNTPPIEWNTWNGSPDIQPGSGCVSLIPFDGLSYLGLGHFGGGPESVAQLLSVPLKAGQTYKFSVALSKTNSTLEFCGGIQLGASRFRMWGCNYKIFDPVPDTFLANELLWQSDTIDHVGWVLYSGMFTPDSNYTYLRLDCENLTGVPSTSYILIDKLSNFEEVHPQAWLNNPQQEDTIACTSLAELETDSLATSVSIYSTLLNQSFQATKLNDTIWQYALNYPEYPSIHNDSLIAVATFAQNYQDTARVGIKVDCIEDPAVYFWQPQYDTSISCNLPTLKIRTDSVASSVEIYSSFLQQTHLATKINDTLWQCTGFDYSELNQQLRDTIIAMGNFTTLYFDTLEVQVSCIPFSAFIIPNLITPNGDGKNDAFFIQTQKIIDKVSIYNRWGEQVFQSLNYQNNWPEENVVEDGVYFYTISVGDSQYKGWIQVLR